MAASRDAFRDTILDADDEAWLRSRGHSEQLYGAIMHPEYRQIRRTETTKFWIRDYLHSALITTQLPRSNPETQARHS